MDQKIFIEKIEEQFEDFNDAKLSMDTEFKKLDGWSSLIALSIMSMCTDEYSVTITADDMRKAVKVSDLYNIVKGLINE